MRFISAVDSATPPTVARTWPSSELPAPNGITGRPSREQTARAAATSAVVRGKITQSGRAGASTDSSRLWCSRVLWAALNREPNILSSSESAFSRDEAGGIASPSWPNVQPERHPQAYASSGVTRQRIPATGGPVRQRPPTPASTESPGRSQLFKPRRRRSACPWRSPRPDADRTGRSRRKPAGEALLHLAIIALDVLHQSS